MTTERKARKTRVDNKENAVVTMLHANRKIDPPEDMEFTVVQERVFHEVIREFAKVDWSDHSIRLAASLALALEQYQTLQRELIDEGYTVTTPKGGVAMNPNMSAMNMISGQIMNFRRTLALHAVAGANKADVGTRRGIRKGQEDDAPEDDGLLARPPMVG